MAGLSHGGYEAVYVPATMRPGPLPGMLAGNRHAPEPRSGPSTGCLALVQENTMSHGSTRAGGRSKGLVLTAMIFAVAMTFIDQTIVAIAAPTIQQNLGLSSSGIQWAINAYLLVLAALFAFGGRLADIAGHRRMVVLGVIIFAGASALCGLTPRGGVAGGVPRGAGRGRGGHVPGRHRDRGGDLRPALARPGAGAVLRYRRGADRDRADRGRLPDRVDLAGDLLDQHPGRADRPGTHRHLQAAQRVPARAHGLPRPGPDHRRRGAERVRLPVVSPVGLEQPSHLGQH